ncbi:hypothetical protein V5799_000324 [Amblyomma americanum]|uniref:Uncharacterized protein n=1 Tax=Amblyomma americanum TaxID=6943 RepID=A0AAQ4D3D2_AMBAM
MQYFNIARLAWSRAVAVNGSHSASFRYSPGGSVGVAKAESCDANPEHVIFPVGVCCVDRLQTQSELSRRRCSLPVMSCSVRLAALSLR